MRFCASCGLELPAGPTTKHVSRQPVPLPEPVSRDSNSIVLLAGGGLVIIGSFLPWISVYTGFGTISRSGIDGGGDGLITLVLGIGIVVIGLTRFLGTSEPSGFIRFWPPLIAGLIAVGLAIFDGIDVSSRIEGAASEYVNGSVGAGLWVIGVGGVLSALAAMRGRRANRSGARLVSAGWWRVEESDLPALPAGKSIHLDFEEDALVINETVGNPIIRLPFEDTTLRVTTVHSSEVAIGATTGWSAVLGRSTDAMHPEQVVREWRAAAKT